MPQSCCPHPADVRVILLPLRVLQYRSKNNGQRPLEAQLQLMWEEADVKLPPWFVPIDSLAQHLTSCPSRDVLIKGLLARGFVACKCHIEVGVYGCHEGLQLHDQVVTLGKGPLSVLAHMVHAPGVSTTISCVPVHREVAGLIVALPMLLSPQNKALRTNATVRQIIDVAVECGNARRQGGQALVHQVFRDKHAVAEDISL